MSTNKTQHYALHSWLPQDEFHVTEINENFTGVDTELAVLAATVPGVRYGTYQGTGYGNPLTIELGAAPKVVFVCYSTGARGNSNGYAYAGMMVEGATHAALTLTDTGFIVDTKSNSLFNETYTYFYCALI